MSINGTMLEVEGKSEQDRALPSTSPDRRLAWVVLLASSAVFLVSATWRPPDEPIIVLCPFRSLTGLLCPGCGMTRAFCALGHGEFRRAIAFNAMSPLLFIALIAAWVGAASTLLKLHRVRAVLMRFHPTPAAAIYILALVLVWWVVRLAGGF